MAAFGEREAALSSCVLPSTDPSSGVLFPGAQAPLPWRPGPTSLVMVACAPASRQGAFMLCTPETFLWFPQAKFL